MRDRKHRMRAESKDRLRIIIQTYRQEPLDRSHDLRGRKERDMEPTTTAVDAGEMGQHAGGRLQVLCSM